MAEFDVCDVIIEIDRDELNEVVDSMADFICEEVGVTPDKGSDAYWDWYCKLDDQMMLAIQNALYEVAGKQCCDPDYWKKDLLDMFGDEED